jgi:hypothetical protein
MKHRDRQKNFLKKLKNDPLLVRAYENGNQTGKQTVRGIELARALSFAEEKEPTGGR